MELDDCNRSRVRQSSRRELFFKSDLDLAYYLSFVGFFLWVSWRQRRWCRWPLGGGARVGKCGRGNHSYQFIISATVCQAPLNVSNFNLSQKMKRRRWQRWRCMFCSPVSLRLLRSSLSHSCCHACVFQKKRDITLRSYLEEEIARTVVFDSSGLALTLNRAQKLSELDIVMALSQWCILIVYRPIENLDEAVNLYKAL